MGGVGGDLADLVLPGVCAGCGAERVPLRCAVCWECAAEWEVLRPYATRPTPAPRGMPVCFAAGVYAGALRGALLAYKERGRYRLKRPLGVLLGAAVAEAAVRGGGGPGVPLRVVPVPSTAGAVRARNGDHMGRLAGEAVRWLRTAGWDVEVAHMLRALPRADSVLLDVNGRLAAAESSLRIKGVRIRIPRRRPTIRGTLIVVDDIVTTGATLAAVTGRLREVDMQVTGAAVVAATRLRRGRAERGAGGGPPGVPGSEVPLTGSRTRGDEQASAG
ncbi:ComF family protein [Winogradskya consettensis]|uniref:ComF family protein n=1 Tax=Winogradskya consettensis TaxID=113560 RepID=UPI001FD07A3E|nr:phosphoribosyltransferase family protein [Actinoplanes consettensis]